MLPHGPSNSGSAELCTRNRAASTQARNCSKLGPPRVDTQRHSLPFVSHDSRNDVWRADPLAGCFLLVIQIGVTRHLDICLRRMARRLHRTDKTGARFVRDARAQVAELVDALVSGTSDASRGGSSPLLGTTRPTVPWHFDIASEFDLNRYTKPGYMVDDLANDLRDNSPRFVA